jgi:hypothetical protein
MTVKKSRAGGQPFRLASMPAIGTWRRILNVPIGSPSSFGK